MKNIEEPRFIKRQRERSEDERRCEKNAEEITNALQAMDGIRKQEAADQKKEKRCWVVKETREWLTLVLLIVTAGATSIYVCFTRQQLAVAKDTEKRQLRAYVFTKPDPTFVLPESGPWPVHLPIRNSGLTPAYHVVVRTPTTFAFKEPVSDQDLLELTQVNAEISVPPESAIETTKINLYPILNTVGNMFDLSTIPKTGENFVYGAINYDDAFGEHHFTNFCFGYQPSPSGENSLVYCKIHQEAN